MKEYNKKLKIALIMCCFLIGILSISVQASQNQGDPLSSDYETRQTILIQGDGQFGPENGVRSGSGTPEDPFIIEGWDIDPIAGGINIQQTSKHVVIRNNRITTDVELTGIGILGPAENIVVKNNIIDVGGLGIYVSNSWEIDIIGNEILGTNEGERGIKVHTSENGTITNNIIANMELSAVWLSAVGCWEIEENVFFEPEREAVYLSGDDVLKSNNISIAYNNFIQCEEYYSITPDNDGRNNSLYDGENRRGNYYSDYQARYPDATNNGVYWDTPVTISDFDLRDNYPLVEPTVEIPDYLSWEEETTPRDDLENDENDTEVDEPFVIYGYPLAFLLVGFSAAALVLMKHHE